MDGDVNMIYVHDLTVITSVNGREGDTTVCFLSLYVLHANKKLVRNLLLKYFGNFRYMYAQI